MYFHKFNLLPIFQILLLILISIFCCIIRKVKANYSYIAFFELRKSLYHIKYLIIVDFEVKNKEKTEKLLYKRSFC